MSKKQNYTIEKHIYVEKRSGAYRFQVKVHPLSDSGTFSTEAEGLRWGRRRRVELLDERDGLAKASATSWGTIELKRPDLSELVRARLPAKLNWVHLEQRKVHGMGLPAEEAHSWFVLVNSDIQELF